MAALNSEDAFGWPILAGLFHARVGSFYCPFSNFYFPFSGNAAFFSSLSYRACFARNDNGGWSGTSNHASSTVSGVGLQVLGRREVRCEGIS